MSAGSKQSNTGIVPEIRPGGTPTSNNRLPLPADLHDWAIYEDELGQPRKVFDDLETGDALPNKALRQLDHAFDLSIYNKQQPKSPRQRQWLETHRESLFDALAQADFTRHLNSTQQWGDAPEFEYGGVTFPKSRGLDVFRAEQRKIIDDNRTMYPGELAQTAEKLKQLAPESKDTPPILQGDVKKEAWISPHMGKDENIYIKDDSGTMTWGKLIDEWFNEKGDDARSFDASHPITQELMKDEGVQRAREAWEKDGRPDKFSKYNSFGIPAYLRELATLDGTGSTLGSYDIHIQKANDGRLRFDIYNNTGWESGTRMPPPIRNGSEESVEDIISGDKSFKGKIKSILNDRERVEGGPGGTFRQHYYWYE